MYIPSYFKEENVSTLQEYISTYGFGLLILADDKGIEASHLPFYSEAEAKARDMAKWIV